MGKLVTVAFLLTLAGPAWALNLVKYDFTGASGDQSFQAASFTVGPVTASPLTRGPGLAPNLGSNSINSSGWTTALAIDGDDYYEFTLSPASGFKFDLERLSFAERRSGTGIRNFQIRTSLDGFATGLESVPAVVPDDTLTRQHSFQFNNQFLGLAEPVILRLYGYAAEAAGGTWRLENYTGTEGSTGGLTIDGRAPLSDISTIYLQDLGPDFVPRAGNALGDLVGHRISTGQAAVRRDNGGVEDLGTLGGSQSRATAISDDGSVIVGWAHNVSGVQNSFRHEGGTMISVLGTAPVDNQSVGIDGQNNVYVNAQVGLSNQFIRWNRINETTTDLLNNAQAHGVNLDGAFVYKATSGGTGYNDGSSFHNILPTSYLPSAGLSDSNVSAGSLSSAAAYYRLDDPQALHIPNVATLGATSNATGVNDHDLIVGNTGATSFLYNLSGDQLIDLNARDVAGADVLFINEVYGITDADVFFGKYTTLEGEQRYFRASFTDMFSEMLPGDFDSDGDVDGRDFLVWQRNPSVGDLADWQAGYGVGGLAQIHTPATEFSNRGASPVPEPGCVALIIAGIIAGCCQRRIVDSNC